MKNTGRFLATATAIILLPLASQAAVLSYTNIYSGATEFAPASTSFNQFNPVLGTLNSINLTVTGQSVGSFNVTTTSTFSTTITGSSLSIVAMFTGGGAPGALFGAPVSPLGTLPPNIGYFIPGNTSVNFSLLTSPQGLPTLASGNLIGNAPYFTGLGNVNLDINELLLLSYNNNRPKTLDYTSLLMNGEATLTYDYTPGGAVPEPGTWAMGALLVSGLALRAWRRRQNDAAPETPVA